MIGGNHKYMASISAILTPHFSYLVAFSSQLVLMGVELPVISAVIARLANPEINLAAYGGVISPVAIDH